MMFTGIVEEIGVVRHVEDTGGDLRVTIAATAVREDVRLGDSIAVSGCCLTVVAAGDGTFAVELSKETVAKTAPRWREGSRVNLERATRLGDRLGGHLVSGHVEGTGRVEAIAAEPGAHVLTVSAPEPLARYLIPKGSITVDGVSLTVVDVGGPAGSTRALPATDFTLWLIPHTLAVTTLGDLAQGDLVNLEADLIAKYLERLVGMAGADAGGAGDGTAAGADGRVAADGAHGRVAAHGADGRVAAAAARSGAGARLARLPDPPEPPTDPPMPDPPAPPAPPPRPPIPEPPQASDEAAR